MISIEAFRRLGSASSWLSLINSELPSTVMSLVLDALSGASVGPEELSAWSEISPHPWPADLVRSAALLGGRGIYKSTIDVIVGCDRLLRWDAGPFVAAGSEVVAVVVSPTKTQSSRTLRNAQPVCEALAALLGGRLRQRSSADSAEFVFEDIPGLNYVPILRVAPADEAAIRGSATVAVIFDEAAWLPSGDKYKSTDRDLRTASTPRLLQFPHSLFLMTSTPGPVGSLFHEACTETPPGMLMIGPIESWRGNPLMSEAEARQREPAHVVEQEFACRSWGEREAQFIRPAAAYACVDEDEEFKRGPRTLLSAIVAVDVANIHDRIAFAVGYVAERKIREQAAPVAVLVVDHIEFWKPSPSDPILTARIADHAAALSRAYGGVPVIADQRSFVDLAGKLEERGGFRVCRQVDEDERKRWISKGGKTVTQRGSSPALQTPRWMALRDLTHGARLSLPDSDEGREAARELTTLRCTQLPSKFFRIDAAAGSTDDIADTLALLAEACFWRPTVRADGATVRKVVKNVRFDRERQQVVSEVTWETEDAAGNVRRAEPPISDASFPQHFATCWAAGEMTANCFGFLKQRLGKEDCSADEIRGLLRDLAREGALPQHFPVIAMIEHSEDPMTFALWHARRG